MARQAWLLVLAVSCAAVLGLADQAETGDSVGVLEEPEPINQGGSFKEIPGSPAGTVVYKQQRMANMGACSSFCNTDFDCTAFSWDASFNECMLLKKDQEALERQTMKAQNEVIKEQGQAAEEQAAEMEEQEEREKKKEADDKKKIEETPVAKLEAEKKTPRDTYRDAIRKEKEAKKMMKDTFLAQKEAQEKVVGTNTVERIAKRHAQEAGGKLAAEHKVFSAAMLNLEEQVMIRDDRKSKEVLLAKGAKEEAEVKYDKIHTAQLNAVRMADKALGMSNAAKDAELKASQAAVAAKLQSEASAKHLKKASEAYKAAELRTKNEEDAKKRADAMMAKTYLKMRTMLKERDARAKVAGPASMEAMDAAAKNTCFQQQEEMRQTEVRIKQELTEQIGKEQRAITEKKIKAMTESAEEAADKNAANEEKAAVKQAKEKADGAVGDLMETLGQEKLLGEVKEAAVDEAKAEKKAAQAKLDKAKAKEANAESTAKEAAKGAAKGAASTGAKAKVQGLQTKVADAKQAVKSAEKAEDAAAQGVTKAKIATADAEADESKAEAAEEGATVKADAKKAAEKKAELEAQSKANAKGAAEKAQAMKANDDVAHNMRAATDQRIAAMVEAAWQKKKAEMGFMEINCDQPHQTTEQKLQQRVEDLESQKLAASKLPASPHLVDPVAAKEIEDTVKSEMQKTLNLQLNSAKKEMTEKLAAQKRKEKEIIAAAETRANEKVAQARKQAVKAEAKAAQSDRDAARAEESAEAKAAPKLKEGWGMVHTRLGEPVR